MLRTWKKHASDPKLCLSQVALPGEHNCISLMGISDHFCDAGHFFYPSYNILGDETTAKYYMWQDLPLRLINDSDISLRLPGRIYVVRSHFTLLVQCEMGMNKENITPCLCCRGTLQAIQQMATFRIRKCFAPRTFLTKPWIIQVRISSGKVKTP